MGQFITKTSPEDDLYILWSTVVDAPIAVFDSTEDLRSYLAAEQHRWSMTVDRLIERIQTHGSTAVGWRIGTWDDPELAVREGAPPLLAPGHWALQRTDQTSYALAALTGDDARANEYLVFRPAED